MSKKKIVSLCLVLALMVTLCIGGSLAYFTDTETKDNTFTVGNIDISLVETDGNGNEFKQGQQLIPGSKTTNNIPKVVTVKNNTGSNDAYLWIEVWIPSALDDGDDNSPAAPGLGNSLHFNYGATVTETKSTYLGSKTIGNVSYNGYVHFVEGSKPIIAETSTVALLDQVYMDSKVKQCTNSEHSDCLILADGQTHYTGSWDLVINGVGIQADGFDSIEKAITSYYGKNISDYLW